MPLFKFDLLMSIKMKLNASIVFDIFQEDGNQFARERRSAPDATPLYRIRVKSRNAVVPA